MHSYYFYNTETLFTGNSSICEYDMLTSDKLTTPVSTMTTAPHVNSVTSTKLFSSITSPHTQIPQTTSSPEETENQLATRPTKRPEKPFDEDHTDIVTNGDYIMHASHTGMI